jgi:hypothetical protein
MALEKGENTNSFSDVHKNLWISFLLKNIKLINNEK